MLLLSLLGSLALGAVWKIDNTIETNKIAKQAYNDYHDTNYDRQLELFAHYQATGRDINGNELIEPHYHPKEVQRLVKNQLEREGIRYINTNQWNLDHCVFDNEGRIVSVAGRRVDRLTKQYKL